MINNLDIKTEYTRMLNNLVVQNYHKQNKKKVMHITQSACPKHEAD